MRIDSNGSNINMDAMQQALSNANKTKADMEIKQIAADEVTLSAARGNMPELSPEDLIRDLEGAQGLAGATKENILQSFDMAIQAQANLVPQRVLELLK